MNKAVYLNRELELYMDEAPDPVVADDEVLIQLKYTGICGSDLHYYRDGRVGTNIVKEPHILGHESSGVVIEIGKSVTKLQPGDEVAIEPGLPCLACEYCLSGRYSLCSSVQFMGAPPYAGTFRDMISHKELFTHKLPEGVDLMTGALVEPFAVGYNVIKKIKPSPGQSVLITGAGPIGITTMLIALASGCYVTITDVDMYRLELAKQLGAHAVVNITTKTVTPDCFDYAVEASGNVSAFDTIIQGCRKGAEVSIVGMTDRELSIAVNSFIRKELTLHAVYRYTNDFQPVLKLLADSKMNAAKMISHEYNFDEIIDAFKFNNNPDNNKMKVMVKH